MSEKTKASRVERLTAELAAKRREHEAADSELDQLVAGRAAALRGTDEVLEAHDAKAAKALRTRDRAAAVMADLSEELARAKTKAEQERQVAEQAKSAAAVAAYRRLAEQEYPAAARTLATVLGAMAKQAAIVADVNDSLPADKRLYPNDFREAPVERQRPPGSVKREFWRDPTGVRCPAPLLVNGEAPAGYRKDFEELPELVLDRPRRAPDVPAIEVVVILPGVAYGAPHFWIGGDE